MKFTELALDENLLRAIKDMGFDEPTHIQEQAIPLVKQGYDVLGESKTGSGKTAAFGLPLLEKVQKTGRIQAIILSPTRELAIQIAKEMRKFSRYQPVTIVEVYGGVPIEKQFSDLEHADIVVGTPGRVLDHMERKTIDFRNVRVLVLDEADRMFDMGFIEDVERIIDALPKERQTLLFSATLNREVKDLAARHLREPKEVRVEARVQQEFLEQYYFDVNAYDKFSLLVHLLQTERPKRAMVFCATRRIADVVAKNLDRYRFNTKCIHGGLPQSKRTRVIEEFHKGQDIVLVATDVAARGLDIKDVTHVFNYDIPPAAEDYVHRVGRTARAGESGVAYALLTQRDYENFQRVLSHARMHIERRDPGRFKRVPFDMGIGKSRGSHRGGERQESRPHDRPRRRPQGGPASRPSQHVHSENRRTSRGGETNWNLIGAD